MFNALPQAAQDFADLVLAGQESTKPLYCCHTFAVLACGPAHPYFAVFERSRTYWRKKCFGLTFDKQHPDGENQPRHIKGFVAMTLGDGTQAPAISTARS